MTYQQFIDMAKAGELKSLAIKTDTEAILSFVNLGLLELYKRFPIKTVEHIVEYDENNITQEYKMPADYMWLVAAYCEVPSNYSDNTMSLPINSVDDPYTVNTVSYNTIQIPMMASQERVSLIYAASPDIVTETDILSELDLPIPPQLIDSLMLYVAYKANDTVAGNKTDIESNVHYTRYELSIKRVVAEGMFNEESLDMSGRLYQKGFI